MEVLQLHEVPGMLPLACWPFEDNQYHLKEYGEAFFIEKKTEEKTKIAIKMMQYMFKIHYIPCWWNMGKWRSGSNIGSSNSGKGYHCLVSGL